MFALLATLLCFSRPEVNGAINIARTTVTIKRVGSVSLTYGQTRCLAVPAGKRRLVLSWSNIYRDGQPTETSATSFLVRSGRAVRLELRPEITPGGYNGRWFIYRRAVR